jgi:hypothetical protein
MKTKKQELIDNYKEYLSEDNLLECWFSERLDKYCLRFNVKSFTYKSINGFINKRNYFIKKYNLQELSQ